MIRLDIILLEQIVRRAEARPPHTKINLALTDAYKAVFAEKGIDTRHDKVIFNWILVTSKRCANAFASEGEVNFLGQLHELLATKGITLEPTDADAESEPDQDYSDSMPNGQGRPKGGRVVSFEEPPGEATWPSEPSEEIYGHTPEGKGLSKRPQTPGRPYYEQPPLSSEVDTDETRPSETDRYDPPSLRDTSDPDGPPDSGMFHATLTEDEQASQLDVTIGAFLTTKDIRTKRRYLHILHDAFVEQLGRDVPAKAIAVAHDARTLLRQAWDQWQLAMQARRDERRQEEEFERMERRAVWFRSLMLAQKSFEHWHARQLALKTKTFRASQLLLAMRYFRRWREITIENNLKARQILMRKFLDKWRHHTVFRRLISDQATARYEERLEKRLYRSWFWQFCSRRVEAGREQRLEHRLLSHWRESSRHVQAMTDRAETFMSHRLLNGTFSALRLRLSQLQQASASAQSFCDRKIRSSCLETIRIQGRLKPLEETMTLRVTLTLQRKAFKVWHLHLSLTRQAAEVDRKRVLHDAWRSWNDGLRTRALGQRIDERILIDSLYKWVLQERLSLFRRAADSRLLRHGLLTLHGAFIEIEADLEEQAAAFAVHQKRRRLASTMIRLNIALRHREDAERAALEFANSRALPDVLSEWKEKTKHARQLAVWAADARWYCLCSSTFKTWRTRTTEHQHQRRRDAYVQIRARVKRNMARKCFTTWRTQGMEIRSMRQEAERRAQVRLFAIGTQGFDQWRELTAEQQNRNLQAVDVDRKRLVASVLSAMSMRHAQVQDLDQHAVAYRLDTNRALQAWVWKRLEWAKFTASRNTQTAEALLSRNHDQHVKQMLRVWFAKAVAAREAKRTSYEPFDEPESPSIRASQVKKMSISRFSASRPTSYTPKTPAYMQTPSRSRRPGRLRLIPTPAPGTPFGLDPGYMTTTPAPLTAGGNGSSPMAGAVSGLTPQITPFSRKLRAGGFGSVPPSALKTSVFGRPGASIGTGKSVRFAKAGRFSQSTAGRIEDPQEDEEGEDEPEFHFKRS